MSRDVFNLAQHCIARAAASTPDKTALIVVGDVDRPQTAERWTYAALDRAVRGVAAGLLANGLSPGDRIMLRLPNSSDYALMFYGSIAAGMVPIPVSAMLTEDETTFLLEDSEAAAIVQDGVPALHAPAGCKALDRAAVDRLKAAVPLEAYARTSADAPAYMIYTSGTASRPKGVVHAHRVALGRVPMYADWMGLTAADTMLHAGAFNWSYTLGVGLLDPWAVGATAVLYSGPKDVEVWPKLIDVFGATLFAAVPSLYRQILKYCRLTRESLPTLRHALAAGEALNPATLSEWQALTGKPLLEAFGMSEISTFVSNRDGMQVRAGSPGKPQTGRPVAILAADGRPARAGEVGLLAVHRSDPGLMLGYWRRPEEEERVFHGDWFAGGDLASFDADGYLWHHGRADDIMNAGGFRVSPLEVEAALAPCPGIAELAVAEHEVRAGVSVIAAFVVTSEDASLRAEDIATFAEQRLAAYKRPRVIFFVPTLPRSANGKLLRRKLTGTVRALQTMP
ncbi:acyl-CoA synthetase [Mesorhizobium sp. M2C.T.Ca.TU.002.02.1.1]|uniref:acyl-CoA synthetase n=1 Tax=Mesorhizobium sp. M2C.T.Ca.TU.002.02.1.1 TaxID=2496788 RepID=UPI000FCAAC61|nr:acyl-CoA synthetase [Mesorhizobium sp. M2C.T.Ca.TU.002.02.1.1]RUU60596.1 AMP-dependent synthetase [Mesorhizobium sp. M2C.T.Ca.TU.002.02.1.1]RUU71859.1 AMP-dependent synthetase [Mesorhizobium sp. M2C.T.Ca.TU.009.01.2.1]